MKKDNVLFSLETGISFLVVAVMLVFLFGSPISGFIMEASAQVSTSTSQTISLTVNQTITLTLSTSTLGLGSLTPGSPVSATSSATVATNAATGWNLKVNRLSSTSSPTIASGTITFPDAASWNGANNATTTPGATLSFKVANTGTDAGLYSSTFWGASDVDGTAKYAGFPTSSQTVATTSTYSGVSQTVVLRVRADSPATQQATNYTGSITITAITNP
jgi:hypothetical protein